MIILLLLINTAFCEDNDSESENRNIIYKKKTEIDFEGLEVEGSLVKPSSSLILERKKSDFNPLIVLRTDWHDKIDESVFEIK
jgi:hypothetical protein